MNEIMKKERNKKSKKRYVKPIIDTRKPLRKEATETNKFILLPLTEWRNFSHNLSGEVGLITIYSTIIGLCTYTKKRKRTRGFLCTEEAFWKRKEGHKRTRRRKVAGCSVTRTDAGVPGVAAVEVEHKVGCSTWQE